MFDWHTALLIFAGMMLLVLPLSLVLATLTLIAGPFVVGFDGSSGGLTLFYVLAGAAVLAVSLITNYQYSDKREWSPSAAVAA